MDHHQIFSFRNRIKCFWDTLILLTLFLVIKMDTFWGDLTDVLAKIKSLISTRVYPFCTLLCISLKKHYPKNVLVWMFSHAVSGSVFVVGNLSLRSPHTVLIIAIPKAYWKDEIIYTSNSLLCFEITITGVWYCNGDIYFYTLCWTRWINTCQKKCFIIFCNTL